MFKYFKDVLIFSELQSCISPTSVIKFLLMSRCTKPMFGYSRNLPILSTTLSYRSVFWTLSFYRVLFVCNRFQKLAKLFHLILFSRMINTSSLLLVANASPRASAPRLSSGCLLSIVR